MLRRFGAGGFMSSRMADRMAVIASSWCLSLPSSSSSRGFYPISTDGFKTALDFPHARQAGRVGFVWLTVTFNRPRARRTSRSVPGGAESLSRMTLPSPSETMA